MKGNKLKIINKILKLLALSVNPNEKEGASALKKAKKLMDEHGITEEEINKYRTDQNQREQWSRKPKDESVITPEQEANKTKCTNLLRKFKIGSYHYYDPSDKRGMGEYELLIVKDIIYSPRENSFPFSPSYFKVKFFSSGNITSETEMTVLFSQEIISKISPAFNSHDNFLYEFQEELNRINDKRYIVTGNLLKALGELRHAKYITYTTIEDEIRTGLLLSKRYRAKTVKYSAEQFLNILKKDRKPITILAVKFQVINNELYVAIPRSKKLGGQYFTDPVLKKLTKDSEGFISTSESVSFKATFESKQMHDCLRRFEDLGMEYTIIQEERI